MKKRRISTHKIETDSTDYIRNTIDGYYENGDALYREVTGRDYGIDAIIELFDNGIPTGKIAFIQIKGTKNAIVPLRTAKSFISCKITASNIDYAIQNRIPVLLFYVSLNKQPIFYFARLQDVITEDQINKSKRQNSISVRIPINNSSAEDLDSLFSLIMDY